MFYLANMDRDELYRLKADINQGMAALMKTQDAPTYLEEKM